MSVCGRRRRRRSDPYKCLSPSICVTVDCVSLQYRVHDAALMPPFELPADGIAINLIDSPTSAVYTHQTTRKLAGEYILCFYLHRQRRSVGISAGDIERVSFHLRKESRSMPKQGFRLKFVPRSPGGGNWEREERWEGRGGRMHAVAFFSLFNDRHKQFVFSVEEEVIKRTSLARWHRWTLCTRCWLALLQAPHLLRSI